MAEPGRTACASCGTSTDRPALSGMIEHDPVRGVSWVCADCLRRDVRAVEAKLDREWW